MSKNLNLTNKTIWQQSCGNGDREYSQICLKHNVILNGPGFTGKLEKQNIKDLRSDGLTSKKVTDLNRFCFDMKDGDYVVLRLGKEKIFAFGIVVGDYEWNDIFSDVDGWDLQHVRRVCWLWSSEQPKEFRNNEIKWGDTTQIMDSPVIRQWIDSLNLEEPSADKIALAELPQEDSDDVPSIESISEFLYDKGMSNNSIVALVNVIDDLHMIAKWYQKQDQPSEFETEAYLIIPLLRALGWTPQKMAIEWNHVDISLFDKLPRNDENLIAVVEAKKKNNSCLTAYSQAERYSQNKTNCNRLVVTDGLRYGVFIKDIDTYQLFAYMNLTEFKSQYHIYDCAGIEEALWAMSPDWHRTDI